MIWLVGAALASFPDPWAVPTDLDIRVISHGEAVDPAEHLAPDKFTIVDLGASWCVPCHDAAAEIRDYMAENDDVAVRAISFGDASLDTYAASELFGRREMIPYLIVYSPSGTVIYEGHSATRALRRIERKR